MPALFRGLLKPRHSSEARQRPGPSNNATHTQQARVVIDAHIEHNSHSIALRHLLDEIKDYQITHGSLLKAVNHETENSVPAVPVGVAVFPTAFPRSCFNDACDLQQAFNRLYAAIAQDEEWLKSVLKDLIKHDHLVSTLWDIHQKTKQDLRTSNSLTLGIFRSDYMLHSKSRSLDVASRDLSIRQVEMNTLSVAGGVHGNIVADMHKYLSDADAYATVDPPPVSGMKWPVQPTMPNNSTTVSLVGALQKAHEEYLRVFSPTVETCILMIVQPLNGNICDERPIQYSLLNAGIPMFRIIHGASVLERTRIGHDQSKALLYVHRSQGADSKAVEYEVSVVYHRAGFEPREYDDAGTASRLRLELSRAVKCPSVLSHLSTLKKVQQALTSPGAVERFVSAEDAVAIRKTFMPIYSLDDSVEGRIGKDIALDPAKARDHILKPCLEGGGHNVFRENIATYLSETPNHLWKNHILMEVIRPPVVQNMLMTPNGLYKGPVVSELGIFGCCLWSSGGDENNRDAPKASRLDFLFNEQGGWSFKTKAAHVDEMSVVKGYGCFDSPMLVEHL